jgi:hypothetical protein
VLGQGLDLPLLLVWVRRAVESILAKGFLKQTKEGVRPMHVGLINLPMHGIW